MGGTGDLKCPAQGQGSSPLPQPRAQCGLWSEDTPRSTCWGDAWGASDSASPPPAFLLEGDPMSCAQGASSRPLCAELSAELSLTRDPRGGAAPRPRCPHPRLPPPGWGLPLPGSQRAQFHKD